MTDFKAESLRLLNVAQSAPYQLGQVAATMACAYATLYAAEQTRRVLEESSTPGVTIESQEEK